MGWIEPLLPKVERRQRYPGVNGWMTGWRCRASCSCSTPRSHDRQLARPGAQGWPKTGPSPVDRAKPGSKHHVITDGSGIPLAVSLTGGNRNDVTQLMPLIKATPPVRGRVGPAP